MLGPVSGAHFNPVVSLADWLLGRRAGTGLPPRDLAPYLAAQILGGIAGTLLAGVMFDTAPALSGNDRATGGHLVGEVVATAGLVLLIFALARTVGWVAQWNEMISDPAQKIGRPRQVYTGATERDYVAIDKR